MLSSIYLAWCSRFVFRCYATRSQPVKKHRRAKYVVPRECRCDGALPWRAPPRWSGWRAGQTTEQAPVRARVEAPVRPAGAGARGRQQIPKLPAVHTLQAPSGDGRRRGHRLRRTAGARLAPTGGAGSLLAFAAVGHHLEILQRCGIVSGCPAAAPSSAAVASAASPSFLDSPALLRHRRTSTVRRRRPPPPTSPPRTSKLLDSVTGSRCNAAAVARARAPTASATSRHLLRRCRRLHLPPPRRRPHVRRGRLLRRQQPRAHMRRVASLPFESPRVAAVAVETRAPRIVHGGGRETLRRRLRRPLARPPARAAGAAPSTAEGEQRRRVEAEGGRVAIAETDGAPATRLRRRRSSCCFSANARSSVLLSSRELGLRAAHDAGDDAHRVVAVRRHLARAPPAAAWDFAAPARRWSPRLRPRPLRLSPAPAPAPAPFDPRARRPRLHRASRAPRHGRAPSHQVLPRPYLRTDGRSKPAVCAQPA